MKKFSPGPLSQNSRAGGTPPRAQVLRAYGEVGHSEKSAASRKPPCAGAGSMPRGGTCALTRGRSFENGRESARTKATGPSSRSSSAARRNSTGKPRAFAGRPGRSWGIGQRKDSLRPRLYPPPIQAELFTGGRTHFADPGQALLMLRRRGRGRPMVTAAGVIPSLQKGLQRQEGQGKPYTRPPICLPRGWKRAC